MPPTVHEIDPDYDTVIALKHPCKDFAPWDPTAEIPEHVVSELPPEPEAKLVIKLDNDDNNLDPLITSAKSKKDKRGKKRSIWPDGNGGASPKEETTNAVSGGSLFDGEARPIVMKLSHNADHVLSSEDVGMANPQTQPADPEEEIVHYHVSSRHLTLASPWFKRTLTSSSSQEAVRDSTDGRFHVDASDWDEEAFLILLNIFHLRKRQIPKIMSVEMLAKIAVLVDYYELEKAEAIEDYVDTWTYHVRRNYPVPTSYGRDLVLWMCISAVFDLSTEFKEATAVAIRESTGSVQTLSLPIPLSATRDIDHKRVDAIDCIISKLHRLLEKYRSTNYSCPHESYSFFCGAFLFGVLHKEMERWGFLAPRPESPFLGWSFRGVCSTVCAVRSPIWYQKINEFYSSYSFVDHPCSLKREIDSIVQDGTRIVRDLKLSDFKGG